MAQTSHELHEKRSRFMDSEFKGKGDRTGPGAVGKGTY